MALNVPSVLGTQLTGSRAVFSLNGKYFAWGSGVDYGFSHVYEEYLPLNSFETQEHVPVRYQATFGCAQFALVDRNLTTFGVQPLMGKSGQDQLINIINKGELNATVEDVLNEKLLLQVYGLKVSGSSFSVTSNTLVMSQVQFVCRRIVEFGN